MSARVLLKTAAESLPEWIGRPAARLPFSWRVGGQYRKFLRLQEWTQGQARDLLDEWKLGRIREIVDYAYSKVPFYTQLYGASGYALGDLRSWSDFRSLPIVDKTALREVELEARSAALPGRLLLNTGGSSGSPLSFYVDSGAFAREWAHMHRIWLYAGYRPLMPKLTLRGRGGKRALSYNAVHNEYVVDPHASRREVFSLAERLLARSGPVHIHGYPSLVAELFEDAPRTLREALSRGVRGVLLGSEYPSPKYLKAIRSVTSAPIVSWYGHSEMATLARSQPRGSYEVLETYGLAEAVPRGGAVELVSTSFWNGASPFIRYATGDLVRALGHESGLLREFEIQEGRQADYVLDRRGSRVSVTALLFGRHHRLFGYASHVQLEPMAPGQVRVHVTVRGSTDAVRLAADFDGQGIEIEFDFVARRAPIRLPNGKLPLVVRSQK